VHHIGPAEEGEATSAMVMIEQNITTRFEGKNKWSCFERMTLLHSRHDTKFDLLHRQACGVTTQSVGLS
jgi:hypothetical protein